MTKKDFEAIARAMKWVKPSNPVVPPRHYKLALELQTKLWVSACESLASECATSNPRFDRSRFLRACGVEV